MLTMREVGEDGLRREGPRLEPHRAAQGWREAWANHVNERLAELGIDARIDHRSYEAQGMALEPQHKIGAAGSAARKGWTANAQTSTAPSRAAMASA